MSYSYNDIIYMIIPMEQLKTLLDQILESYKNIVRIESSKGSAKDLVSELRSIINAYNQMQHIYNSVASKTPIDYDLLNIIRNMMRDPFLTTLNMQISLLSLDDVISSPELIRDQANLTIKTMNLDGSVSKLKELLK
jgi:predicted nucleotide-binding protein (sugar kinase/HSP70/actin superfamily)